VFFSSENPLQVGDYVQIRITDTLDYDLLGEVIA
jgi:ribosomal protein S12 methylthiotransferase